MTFILILTILSSIISVIEARNNNNFRNEPIVYEAIILVRAAKPTSAQIARYKEWESSLASCYKLVILTDNQNLRIPGINIEVISDKEVLSKWPALKTQGGLCNNQFDKFYMWSSSHEHIVLWSRKTKLKFKYLWNLEQDLGYFGNINDLFRKYDEYDSDIISLPHERKDSQKWWIDCYSQEYNLWRQKLFDPSYRHATRLFVFRVNRKVLDLMYQQFESKRHTINEAVLFELAFAFKLSVRQISHRNIGYKFKFYERVDEKEWEKINNNGANKDRLFHALKF